MHNTYLKATLTRGEQPFPIKHSGLGHTVTEAVTFCCPSGKFGSRAKTPGSQGAVKVGILPLQ